METPTSQVSLDNTQQSIHELEKHNTFAPQINKKSEMIVRDRPVQDLLYDDAMRRNEMSKQRVAQANLEHTKSKTTKISNTNIEYLVHKFNREFEPVYESIVGAAEGEGEGEEEEQDSESQAVNYR